MALVRRTDHQVSDIVKQLPSEARKYRGNLFADLYMFERGGIEPWPTSLITTACHNAWNAQSTPSTLAKIETMLDGSEGPTAGELHLGALLLRRHDGDPPSCLPKLLRLCRGTGLYHLRL
jgi:hypothetical protein